MIPLVVEEDVVVLMIVFQDLKQRLLGLWTCSRERMGAQDRGWKPRRGREETLDDIWGRYFGSGRLVSGEKVANRRGHRLSLLSS